VRIAAGRFDVNSLRGLSDTVDHKTAMDAVVAASIADVKAMLKRHG
jgi:hypothetical protein